MSTLSETYLFSLLAALTLAELCGANVFIYFEEKAP